MVRTDTTTGRWDPTQTTTDNSSYDVYYKGSNEGFTSNMVCVYDLKSLQKQRVLIAKKRAKDNLKNGWINPILVKSVHKEIFKPIKIVIRNKLPVKIKVDEI